jgi:hypothetical protein
MIIKNKQMGQLCDAILHFSVVGLLRSYWICQPFATGQFNKNILAG